MADDSAPNEPGVTETPAIPGNEERIKNLQAEMQRKIDNQAAQLQDTNRQLSDILAAINTRATTQQPAASNKKMADLLFDDPEAAINQIAEQVGNRVGQQVMGQVSAQGEFQQRAAQLEAEYPEFADRTSEHYRKVTEQYAKLPKNVQGTPQGLEIAAYRVAAETGLLPKSKRQTGSQDSEFSVSSGGSSRPRAQSRVQSGEMKGEQQAFANLIGAPVNDPKFKELFKKATTRTEWNKYKGED